MEMNNLHVRTSTNRNTKPDKEKNSKKIDDTVAIIIALDIRNVYSSLVVFLNSELSNFIVLSLIYIYN